MLYILQICFGILPKEEFSHLWGGGGTTNSNEAKTFWRMQVLLVTCPLGTLGQSFCLLLQVLSRKWQW